MSEDDLVRRLQVGHDSGCAMSYGMHEHCCDCSYPDRQESAETILKLRQELAAAQKRYSALESDFSDMSLERDRLKTDLAPARALLREVREWIPYYRWIPDLRERVDAIIGKKTP